ncbi:MAG: hypothetical protein JOZ36_02920 [Acidobacteria bacterium]|nr:hypothetical protein [Acidobacteriota bacterium]
MPAEADPKNDLWAFREGRKSTAGETLFDDLRSSIAELCAHPRDSSLAISALLRAGEFEAGLADAISPAHMIAQCLTDELASVFLGESKMLDRVRALIQQMSGVEFPESLSISAPEGFAYYALHPHDYARLAETVVTRNDSALVVGIRSIGTTLSAIVCAALKQRDKAVIRITVRPTGHPYDRVVHFSADQLESIHRWNVRQSDFLVVDEGPGRSGSSFLSAGETLARAGVPVERITLLGSRQADVNQLCTTKARERWSRFRFRSPKPAVYTRFKNHIYVGGGSWRNLLLKDDFPRPACWPQMERLKFLSPDRKSIFKFEGFGRFGQQVITRAGIIAKAGFGCQALDAGDGMIVYPVVRGQALTAAELSTELLERLARYCAFRAAEFRMSNSPPSQLSAMLKFNVLHEFGIELFLDTDDLSTAEPILSDARMQPHEWIRRDNSQIVKVDAYTHGDDHFFPGPSDVAWDLAGAIVEWNLQQDATDYFLSTFRRVSGIDRSQQLDTFILAYTVLRLAYWKMALPTVKASSEEQRVAQAYEYYRALAQDQLRKRGEHFKGEMLKKTSLSRGDVPIAPRTAA